MQAPAPESRRVDTPGRDFLISGPRAFVLRNICGRLRLVDLSRAPSDTFFVEPKL